MATWLVARGNKEVLAIILKGVAREFEGYSYEEIMEFIEADSITTEENVSPGRTNTRIIGDDKEYAALNEKLSLFDTKFRVINPELSGGEVIVNLHVDVEAQKTYRPGDPIEKRGIYYLARELSAQLSLVQHCGNNSEYSTCSLRQYSVVVNRRCHRIASFLRLVLTQISGTVFHCYFRNAVLVTEHTDYGCLEKCYSIWICRDNVPKDERFSISFLEMSNTRNYGTCNPLRENYDLLTLVIIRLGDKVFHEMEDKEKNDMMEFLHAIMYPHKDNFMETIKKHINFSDNEELWKEVAHMSGLGLSIREECLEEGRIEGREEGRAEEIIESGYDFGMSKQDILARLQKKLQITLEQAEEYMKVFGKQLV